MSGIMDKFKQIPTHMDYEGQRKAEKIFQTIILVFASVGLLLGYTTQQLSHTIYFLGVGFIICCVLTLPPWPKYRQNPISWQKPREEVQDGQKHRDEQKSKKRK